MSTCSVHTIQFAEQPELWQQLHTDAGNRTVFSSLPWLRILAELFEREASAVLLLRGDRPVAGIPLMMKRRGFLRATPPLPITMYTGLLLVEDSRLWMEDIPLLLRAVERRCHFASLSTVLPEQLRQQFVSRQWDVRRMQNRTLQLHDSDTLWQGYSQSLRRKIRRTSETGLRIDSEANPQTLAECYNESYNRHGILPPIPPVRIQEWLTKLRRQGLVDMYAATRTDGRCVATRAMIRDGDTLYDWLAGSNPPLAPSGSHWLLHQLLEKYHAEGCTRFDFMGANTPGVSDFKRSFGGTVQNYEELEWYRPALLKQVNALRGRLRMRQRGLT
ncbi:GNAT family N-acetyltransferase [bacterium]|nr:GNAT family N-acetyltransferase [bacterium]